MEVTPNKKPKDGPKTVHSKLTQTTLVQYQQHQHLMVAALQ
jgi:hypothetical protein